MFLKLQKSSCSKIVFLSLFPFCVNTLLHCNICSRKGLTLISFLHNFTVLREEIFLFFLLKDIIIMMFLFLKGPLGNFYMESYLDGHPEFLDSYVLRKVKPGTVERWHLLQQPLAVPGELAVSLDTVYVSQSNAVILTVDQSEYST